MDLRIAGRVRSVVPGRRWTRFSSRSSTALINFQNPNAAAATVTCTAPATTEFIVSLLPLSVPAAGNADLTVSFSSATPGAFNDTLACSGSGGELFDYTLSATAVAAPVVVSPAVIPSLDGGRRRRLVFAALGLSLLLARQRPF